jgi:predicted protein tyrosine phosphatase
MEELLDTKIPFREQLSSGDYILVNHPEYYVHGVEALAQVSKTFINKMRFKIVQVRENGGEFVRPSRRDRERTVSVELTDIKRLQIRKYDDLSALEEEDIRLMIDICLDERDEAGFNRYVLMLQKVMEN